VPASEATATKTKATVANSAMRWIGKNNPLEVCNPKQAARALIPLRGCFLISLQAQVALPAQAFSARLCIPCC